MELRALAFAAQLRSLELSLGERSSSTRRAEPVLKLNFKQSRADPNRSAHDLKLAFREVQAIKRAVAVFVPIVEHVSIMDPMNTFAAASSAGANIHPVDGA